MPLILLDTHIWVWWIHQDPRLSVEHRSIILNQLGSGLGVSAISVWEVAKLVELNRLVLNIPVLDWLNGALGYPGIHLLPLTSEIAVEATQLPGSFHRDPADQIIVATARVYNSLLLTIDARILSYSHVRTTP